MATILCGKYFIEKGKREVDYLLNRYPNFKPRLDIIKANTRADSAIYVRRKVSVLAKVGISTRIHEYPQIHPNDLEEKIRLLNKDEGCHGILIQSPVNLQPETIDRSFFSLVSPEKDVDGLHPENLGRLAKRKDWPLFIPCTPLGIVKMLEYYKFELVGKRAVVLGRSEIVGTPMSLLLSKLDMTVTVCHSKSKNLPENINEADLLVAAIGRPKFVEGSWIKPGAIVIDVGINRLDDSSIVGDVDFEGSLPRAGAITPVPGGVGPMTIAMLVNNMIKSAYQINGISLPQSSMIIE